jgi:hypothetical protein
MGTLSIWVYEMERDLEVDLCIFMCVVSVSTCRRINFCFSYPSKDGLKTTSESPDLLKQENSSGG